MTQSASSCNRSNLTFFCQCNDTGVAVWKTLVSAFLSSWIATSRPYIEGRGWWGHVLKVNDLKYSSNHFFILQLFPAEQGKGSFSGNRGPSGPQLYGAGLLESGGGYFRGAVWACRVVR